MPNNCPDDKENTAVLLCFALQLGSKLADKHRLTSTHIFYQLCFDDVGLISGYGIFDKLKSQSFRSCRGNNVSSIKKPRLEQEPVLKVAEPFTIGQKTKTVGI